MGGLAALAAGAWAFIAVAIFSTLLGALWLVLVGPFRRTHHRRLVAGEANERGRPITTTREVHSLDGGIPLRDRIMAYVRTKRGAHVDGDDPHRFEAHFGSQVALRIKGGMFAPVTDFPIRVIVTMDESPGVGTDVRIAVADDLGFGTVFGMRQKYTRLVHSIAEDLAEVVAAPGEPASASDAGSR